MEKLEQEISIIEEYRNQEDVAISPRKDVPMIEPKKEKKTVFEYIHAKLKKKPATMADIDQLKKEVIKSKLEAELEKNKAAKRKYKGSSSALKELFGNGSEGKGNSLSLKDSKEKEAYRKKILGF